MSKILQNAKLCKACDQFVVSFHRHDYVGCSCHKVFVDGGFDYLRQSIDGVDYNLYYDDDIETIRWKYLVYDSETQAWEPFPNASEAALERYDELVSYPDFLPIWDQLRNKPIAQSFADEYRGLVKMYPEYNSNLDDEAYAHLGDKPDHSLVSSELIDAAARGKGFGVKKYGRNQYLLEPMNWTKNLASLSRHVHEFLDGKDYDEESGLCILDHIAARVEMALVYWNRGLGKDDRFKGGEDNGNTSGAGI